MAVPKRTTASRSKTTANSKNVGKVVTRKGAAVHEHLMKERQKIEKRRNA